MKRLVAIFVFLLSFSSGALATAQIPETLVLDGQGRALFTNPLDPWLREPTNAEKLKSYISPQRCSASWRGYAGTWEIHNERLVLVRLRSDPCSQKSTDVPLTALFPGRVGAVVATWFSGSLTVPDGKQTQYVHMGYMPKYERYIILQVESGRVVSRQTVNELPRHPIAHSPFPANEGPPPPRIVP